jgi:hypothetical protein
MRDELGVLIGLIHSSWYPIPPSQKDGQLF